MQHSYCVEKNRDCEEALPRSSSSSSRLELMDSLKALKTWQWWINDANDNTPATTSANSSSATAAVKSSDPIEEDNKMSVIMKRFGMMFGHNTSLKDEVVPRSSSENNDVAVPTMMSMVIPPASQSLSAAHASNNTIPSSSRHSKSSSSSLRPPPPRSILKSTRVYHSDEVDDDVSNATSSTDLLRLLMVSDSFPTEDRVNIGVDENAVTAEVVRKGAGGRRTNSVVDSDSKEERGRESAKEAATKEAIVSLFNYKPQSQRSISQDCSTTEKESASPPSPESTSSPERVIKLLQALALLQEQREKRRISNDTTATTTLLGDSESQVSCNSFIGSSSNEPSICFSTGTFKDARKRHVHELENKIPTTMVQQSDSTSNNFPEVIGAEAARPGNIFQRYMENKAKVLLQQNQQQQKYTAKTEEPKAGELLVDWGDECSLTESEDDNVSEEQQAHHHETYITFSQSRRVSDLTTTDCFSDDDSEFDITLDNSYTIRERIRSLSIAEEDEEPARIVDHSDVGGEREEEDDEDVGSDGQEMLPTRYLQRYSSGDLGKGLIKNMTRLSLVELHDEDEDVVDESDEEEEDKSPPTNL